MHYWLKVVLTIYKNCPPYLCYSNKNVNSVGLSWFLTQYVKQPENSKICFGWLAQSNAKKVWWKNNWPKIHQWACSLSAFKLHNCNHASPHSTLSSLKEP